MNNMSLKTGFEKKNEVQERSRIHEQELLHVCSCPHPCNSLSSAICPNSITMSPSLLAKIHLASLIVRKQYFHLIFLSVEKCTSLFCLQGNDILAGENISNARLSRMSKSNGQYFIVEMRIFLLRS